MLRLLGWVFPLILISSLSALSIVIFISAFIFDEQLEKVTDKNSKYLIFLFNEYMNQSESQEEWLQRFDHIQQLSDGAGKIIPFSELPDISDEKKQRLMAGEYIIELKVSFLCIYPSIYIYNKEYNKLIVLDEYLSKSRDDEIKLLQSIIYIPAFILLLFFISLWLAFHWHEMKKLMLATEKISNGDFTARAKLSRLSSIKLLAEKINKMTSYIERLVNGQRELIHSVSHELRTPISRLSFGLELLKKMSQDPNQAKMTLTRIEDLEEDVQELSDLVSELLQLAKVGQQYHPELQCVDLNNLLYESIKTICYPEQQKEVVIQLANEADQLVYKGDARLLERAIINILRNADKYAQNKICLSSTLSNVNHYQIIIEDDGPGIPEEERLRIFEPFYRLENIWDKKVSGYGLGLSIAQKIIQVHGGTIIIEKSKLGGAKFVINLSSNRTL